MFDWACMVVDSFGMDRQNVALSMDLLDRYVAHELARTDVASLPAVTRDDFQLFSMTTLYMAVKILEPFPRKITVQALVDMSRGFYSEIDIQVTEREILVGTSARTDTAGIAELKASEGSHTSFKLRGSQTPARYLRVSVE